MSVSSDAPPSQDVEVEVRDPDTIGELDIDKTFLDDYLSEIRSCAESERERILCEIVENLPNPDEVEFILGLTYLLGATDDDYDLQNQILDWMEDIIESPPESVDRDPTFVRFVGFHALTIHSYSNEIVLEWGERHEKYRDYFIGWEYEPMYRFDRAMYDYHTDEESNIMRAREKLRFLAENDLRNNTGVLNAYVSCTIRACQKDLSVSDEEIRDATEVIRRAIRLFPFPEYFRNWGRLLSIYGERTGSLYVLNKAKEKIRSGMERSESTGTRDLDAYRHHLNTVRYRQRIVEADSQIADLQERLQQIDERAEEVANEVRSDTLQFIGFFSAIITFIVTTVQFSTSLNTVSQIASSVAIMTGCLVFGFSAFMLLFDGEKPRNHSSSIGVVWLIGLLLIAGGLGFSVLL